MPVLSSRLDKLMGGLSPKERAILVLRAQAAGEEPGPEITRNTTENDRRVFNRYMALIYVANAELAALCNVIAYHVGCVDFDLYRINLLEEAAGLIEEEQGWQPQRARRDWRKAKGEITVPAFLRGLAAEIRQKSGARSCCAGTSCGRWRSSGRRFEASSTARTQCTPN